MLDMDDGSINLYTKFTKDDGAAQPIQVREIA
jgi:hypothetical protein